MQTFVIRGIGCWTPFCHPTTCLNVSAVNFPVQNTRINKTVFSVIVVQTFCTLMLRSLLFVCQVLWHCAEPIMNVELCMVNVTCCSSCIGYSCGKAEVASYCVHLARVHPVHVHVWTENSWVREGKKSTLMWCLAVVEQSSNVFTLSDVYDYSPCGLRGIMHPWFICWFLCYIYCLLVYIVCFPTYTFCSLFSLLIYSRTYLFLSE